LFKVRFAAFLVMYEAGFSTLVWSRGVHVGPEMQQKNLRRMN